MEHIRLTSFIRDGIMENVAKQFEPERKKLAQQELEFAVRLYREIYPDWRKMARAPKGWLHTYTGFEVRVDGQRRYYRLENEVPMPAEEPVRNMPAALKEEAFTLELRKEKFMERLSEARRQTRAVIHSVTTLKKLLEVWPECKKLLPKELKEPTTTALAIPIPQLNSMLGLGGVK